ncbi:IS30 family transposase [Kineothrix alysoides]|uniref:IS30 family transposase n=1 Tax=Kineothrix alysoides TaxID=1469948 RepID=A0A4R1R3T2_9FIRM|nr:IS30 family transposase [Kineothrix alysoides]TCL59982.1 IS30 family transposase [Kineothrix alysoides]
MSAYIKEHERYIIETMLKDGKNPKEIAQRIGKHYTTVYREIKRGTVLMRDGQTWLEKSVYCADVSQRIQEERGHNKGIDLKVGNDYAFMHEVERLIKEEKYSPYAALVTVRKSGNFKTDICTATLYSYIHSRLFWSISAKDLPYQKTKRTEKKIRHCYHMTGAKKIEERPKEVNEREIYGHWEMDTVYSGKGKSKACLLVLTERMLRKEIVKPIRDRTAKSVVKALDRIEREYGTRRFRSTFKTITCDNGVEFSAHNEIERSLYGVKPRTSVYFCHPFCSSERGSNENANKLIRRHIPKGADIADYSVDKIQYIEDWINNYPRKMFGGLSVNEYRKSLAIP